MYIHVVGARPNFIKAAPVVEAMTELGLHSEILHTGQHYDAKMSATFFDELNIPHPKWNLGIGGGTHAEVTGKTMIESEVVFTQNKPTAVIVYGDVNATLACAITAVKHHIPVIHIESGLRSGDLKMPEEVNRILVDRISDTLFCTEPDGGEQLIREGVDASKIHIVGNVAIDNLRNTLRKLKPTSKPALDCILCTLHRPSNVDDSVRLTEILTELGKLDNVIIPAHPRLKNNIKTFNITVPINIALIDPLGYADFITLLKDANGVISDSGGIQCEAAVLKTPLITLRDTLEHKITEQIGANQLCFDITKLPKFNTEMDYGELEIWDGNASKRIAQIIKEQYER